MNRALGSRLSVLASLLALSSAPPPSRRWSVAPRETADSSGAGWKLARIELDVVALPDSETVRVAGALTVTAPAGGSLGPALAVASGGMRLESVEAAGASVTLSTGGDTARVRLAAPADSGAAVVVRFRSRARQPRVARSVALGREGAFASWYGNWYPWLAATKGRDPSISARGTLRLAIPASWSGLSNGRLVDSTVSGGVRRERWESAQPLAWSFIAAPYVVTRHRVGATDVAIHLMPRQAGEASAFAAAVPPMVAILEKAYGPYPFGTFGVAAIPAGIAPPGIGGRSEQGYFLAHEHALDADTVDVPLFAHELAHMWWANAVLSDPPGDDMMDEGMASHGASLVVEARHGRAGMRSYMRDGSVPNSAHTFFHLWRIGADEPLMNDFATLPSYSKGAWFYEMLRDRVGDSTYFAVLRRFVRDYAGRSATLPDLRAAFLQAVPPDGARELTRFFADWLDRAGAPVLDVRWSAATLGGRPAARVEVTQRTRPYRLPLDVDVASRRGALRSRVLLTDSVQAFVLPARGAPTAVRLDPEHRLMLWEPEYGPVPGVTRPLDAAASRAWLRDELAWLRRMYGAGRVSLGVVRGHRVAWTATAGDSARPWPFGDFAASARQLDPARFARDTAGASVASLAALWADALAAAAGRGGTRASPEAARAMLAAGDSLAADPFGATRRGGLGFRLVTRAGAVRLSYVDAGSGRTLVLLGYPDAGAGCVIVTDDERSGVALATQVAQRVAVVEGWPGMRP